MPLQVIIVGAGISGLCAAVALQQAGHSVKVPAQILIRLQGCLLPWMVLEKSHFAGEVGAAVALTPNGSRVLARLGFDFRRARADDMLAFQVLDGATLAPLHHADVSTAERDFGAPFYTIHRVDMHNELLRLTGTSGLDLRLASRVVDADARAGCVVLADGTRHYADLVVAADGVHSVLRALVVGDEDAARPIASGMSAFRFMLPTEQVRDDPVFQELSKIKGRGNSVFADTAHQTERHMVWYTCRDGQLQNFGGIHDSTNAEEAVDLKSLMMEEFSQFHPSLTHLLKMAPAVTDWPLNYLEPLASWHKGKIVLIGDAAHPMLPFGAQGANQALEDAGAIAAIFGRDVSANDVSDRLALFERVRRLRASRVQTMSRVRLGKEKEVEDETRRFADPQGSDVPTSFSERHAHDYGHDVFAASNQVLSVTQMSAT